MEKVTKTSTKKVKPVAKKVVIKNANTTEIQSIATDLKNVATEIVDEIKVEVSKVDLTDNVEKIKDSAKALNTQFKASATEIADEVKDITAEVSKATKKTVKQIAKKVDVKGNVAKAKKVATKLNTQIVENVEDFKKNTTKLANEMVENMNVSDRLETIKSTIKNANEVALKNTSELIDGLEVNVVKWQGVAEKALKTGLKLADNQSNMMFTTLEALKNQVGKTSTRFKKLFTV
jgi:hypothetical protein